MALLPQPQKWDHTPGSRYPSRQHLHPGLPTRSPQPGGALPDSRWQPECPPRRHCSPPGMRASPHGDKQFPTCPSVTSSVSAEVNETSASSWGHRRNPSLRVRSWRPSHQARARNQQKGHVQVQAPRGTSLPPSLYRRDEDSHQLPTQDGGLKSTQWHLGATSPSTPRSPLPFSLPQG